jgi:hypothetical protein
METQQSGGWWAELAEAAEHLVAPLIHMVKLFAEQTGDHLEEWDSGKG